MTTTYRKRKTNMLPYNWRQQVVELLNSKGIEITVERISSLMAGKATNAEQEKHLRAAIKKLQRAEQKRQPLSEVLEN